MAKRQNGEGTIYQRKSGLWCADLTIGYDDSGKRIKKSLSSMDKETLLKKVDEERRKLHLGIVMAKSDYTVAEWLDEWYRNYKEHNIRNKTMDSYNTSMNLHIKPIIGSIKLNKLTTIMIQQIYNNLTKQGKYNTAGKVSVVINQSLNTAVKLNLIHTNPNANCIINKRQREKVTAMTADEQLIFEQVCKERNNNYTRAFLFILRTGLRIGELCALTWSDVDFVNNTISINKTAGRVNDYDETGANKTKIIINETTKTEAGERIIPLTDKAKKILANQERNSIYTFPTSTGTIMQQRNIRRELKIITNKINIKTHVTPHVLRHTFATRMLEKGANIKALSAILGHKRVQITLDLYTDVMINLKQETMNLLNPKEPPKKKIYKSVRYVKIKK